MAVWPTVIYQLHVLRHSRGRVAGKGVWRSVGRGGAELSLQAAKDRVEGNRIPDFKGQGYRWRIDELPACVVETATGAFVIATDSKNPFAQTEVPRSPARVRDLARLAWPDGLCYILKARRPPPRAFAVPLSRHSSWSDGIRYNVNVLGEQYITELLSLVEGEPADEGERLAAERDRLRGEINNLVLSVAKGMPAETIAPVVREYEAEIAKLEAALARPRPAAIDKAQLRAALEQRTTEWRAALRAEPEVARIMIRRLIGPITVWHEEAVPAFIKQGDAGKENIGEGDILWAADIKPEALAEGLVGVPVSRWRS
jgi:hypothetical protein